MATKAPARRIQIRRIQAAKMYMAQASLEQIADALDTSVPTASRDVNAGLKEIQERQLQDAQIQRTIALARYQQWISDEDGETAASRANRIKLQQRIDRIMGIDKLGPSASADSRNLAEDIEKALANAS